MSDPNAPPPEALAPDTPRLTGDATAADLESLRRRTSVYVYEAPVRLWHWLNAACITILIVTGYLIGRPLPSMQIAEAYDQFVMGYIRFAHFAAAQLLTVGFFGRIYWAFVGNHHAKQMFYIPIFKKVWWQEVFFELR